MQVAEEWQLRNSSLKGLLNSNSMRTHFSSEGVLEAIKIKISLIPTTDNLPPNLSRRERKALHELKCDKTL